MKATTRLSILAILVTLAAVGFSLLFANSKLHYLADGEKGVPRPEVADFWGRQVPLAFGLGSLAIGLVLGLRRSQRRREAVALTIIGVLGAALLLSSIALIESMSDASPALVGVNWIPRAPSFLLVRLLENPTRPTRHWLDGSGRPAPASPPRTVQQQTIYDEILRRQQEHSLSAADRAVLARREFAGGPPFTIETRARWPEGVPVRVTVSGRFAGFLPRELRAVPDFAGGEPIVAYHGGVELRPDRQRRQPGWVDRASYAPALQSIGVPPAGSSEVAFRTTVIEAGDVIWQGDVVLPIVVGGAVDDIMRPVKTAEVLALMIDSVVASLRLTDHCSRVVLVAPEDPLLDGISMGVAVEFLDRDAVAATAVLRWSNPPAAIRGGGSGSAYSRERWAALAGNASAVCAADRSDPRWSVRVRGDGATALDDYDATAYWSGSFAVPLGQIEGATPP